MFALVAALMAPAAQAQDQESDAGEITHTVSVT
jgi:hypothetical protein